MDKDLESKVEGLEEIFGPIAVMKILDDGTAYYLNEVKDLFHHLFNPEGAFAQNVVRVIKASNPEGTWAFQKSEANEIRMIIKGVDDQATLDKINSLFNFMIGLVPGLNEKYPGCHLDLTVEPDPPE